MADASPGSPVDGAPRWERIVLKIKGTHGGVDGVYTADPKLDPTATKLDEVTYLDVLNKGLAVMDPTSITFCMDNHLPIVVYDALTPGNLGRVLTGAQGVGTLVR